MLILIHNRSRAGLASREVGDARERAGRDRSLEARTAHAPTRACCMLITRVANKAHKNTNE